MNQACSLCGRECFGRDTHPCCARFWTREKGCFSCDESRRHVHRPGKPAGKAAYEVVKSFRFPGPITEATICKRCRRSVSQHCTHHWLRCCPDACPGGTEGRFSPPQPYIVESTLEVAS